MNGVSRLFLDTRPNVFSKPDNVAGGSHANQASVVGDTVEFGMNFDPAFAKFFSYIIGKFYVGAVNIRDFSDDGVKFI